jgi:PadR family transcriptional regulator AphA
MHVKTDDHPIDLRTLSPTAHLVLGMVALFGPMTSYQLEQRVGATVASFWLFPHSQLYAEPRKLSDAGLLQETVEPGGRKRRTYEVTNAGHAALDVWFSEPESGRAEARDPGLLKLFFADLAGADDVRRLAESQARSHRARERELQIRRRRLSDQAGRHVLATRAGRPSRQHIRRVPGATGRRARRRLTPLGRRRLKLPSRRHLMPPGRDRRTSGLSLRRADELRRLCRRVLRLIGDRAAPYRIRERTHVGQAARLEDVGRDALAGA